MQVEPREEARPAVQSIHVGIDESKESDHGDSRDTRFTLEERRAELLARASGLLLEVVALDTDGTFRGDEDALARALAGTGREATRELLERRKAPEPEQVIIDGKAWRKVLEDVGSCRVVTPFGIIPISRALYREVGQRGVKGATTTGLLEKRAGLIEATTPRMAELAVYYDAVVTSREAEKLMDLAGLQGPRRSTLEKKAGVVGGLVAKDADALLAHARNEQPPPEAAVMVTIGMDRVNVPYEELNPGGQKSERTRRLREKKPYERKEPEPVVRAFHGDFVGSVTFRDEHGELAGSYSYGLSHADDPSRLADWLLADVVAALRHHPTLHVSVCQDGARELWPLIWEAVARRPELTGVEVRACVDFHHFIPRVRNVVEMLWGRDAYRDWERRLLDESGAVLALHDAVLQEFERLGKSITTEQLEAIHSFSTYIEERTRVDGREDRRAQLFDYAGLRALGLPIGSGPTEATAKSMASVRMKRCGDRWSVDGARATLTCRGIALSSGRWDIIWAKFASAFTAEVIPLQSDAPGAAALEAA
jgi:hypothetical protein